jgi:hypothetical protein
MAESAESRSRLQSQGWVPMPSDPKECRLRARECLQMAKRAATEKERQIFLRLERSWNRLAAEIEDAQAFLATLKATDLVTPWNSR